MSRIVCLAIVMSGALLTWAGPASAGMSEGIAAATVGDYPKAISEFQPLAAKGDAAAQYQLAKLYLEGHGPADGVAQGIDLMTKAANGNHPEAQAQLGLMYAMGLGVPVDNAKAYDWLSKAIAALPEGMRRTVAEANRDAVKKRMAPASTAVASAAPASTTATTTKTPTTAASTAATGTTTAPAKPKTDKTPTATVTPPPKEAQPAAVKPTVAETKAKPATTVVADATKTKPATTVVADTTKTKPATSTPPATVTEVASTQLTTKKPDAGTTQVASAKAPEPTSSMPKSSGPASQQKVQSGIRVQVASMPTEEAAWKQWKRLSDKYGAQLTGLTAIVQPADLGTKGTFYRVQTGPFESIAAAEQRCSTMKKAGLDCLVIGTP